jgi:hypothetical protein
MLDPNQIIKDSERQLHKRMHPVREENDLHSRALLLNHTDDEVGDEADEDSHFTST